MKKCIFCFQKEWKLKINKKILFLLLPIIAGVILIDLLTKQFICAKTQNTGTYSFLPGVLNFTYVENLGAAWNIFSGNRAFLIIISVVFLILLTGFYYLERKQGVLFQISCALIFGGAIGNMIDRIFLGYVRDFVQFDFWRNFPVFNFADACLCVGVVLLVIFYFISLFKEKKCKQK